jgi:hypothetical protein
MEAVQWRSKQDVNDQNEQVPLDTKRQVDGMFGVTLMSTEKLLEKTQPGSFRKLIDDTTLSGAL